MKTMTISDLELKNNTLSWMYNEKKYTISKKNINMYFELSDHIELELINNDGTLTYEDYNFKSDFVFSYDYNHKIIHCYDTEFKVENSLACDFDLRNNRVYCICGENIGLSGENHLEIYDRYGNLLKKLNSPFHYGFLNVEAEDGSVEITLFGDETTQDKYGRSEYRYKYDFDTDQFSRIRLSY